MPIIRNLRKDFDEGRMDNLRSLTYEERGTQGPYVKKDINNPPSSSQLGLQANKRIDDVSRIAQMLVDKPGLKHLSNEAILKQGEITKKLEGKDQTTAGKILRRVGGTVKHVAQVAASTIAQVPVNGTGTHFLRAFKTDTYLQDGDPAGGFASFFGAGGVEGTQYALRGQAVPSQGTITDSKLPSRNTTVNPGDIGIDHIGIEGDVSVENDISAYNSAETYTKTDTKENIFKANSGFPINGGDKIETINPLTGQITELTIPTVGNTTPEKGTFGVTNKDVEGDITGPQGLPDSKYNSDNTYTGTSTKGNINYVQTGEKFGTDGNIPLRDNVNYDSIESTSKSIEKAKDSTKLYDGSNSTIEGKPQGYTEDFRSQGQTEGVPKSNTTFTGRTSKTYALDYNGTKIKKEARIGLGNPGKITRNRTSYTVSDRDTIDALNALDVRTDAGDGTKALNGGKTPALGTNGSRDLIQFEFQIMTPDNTHYLGFRAFLDQFDDSFNGSWNSHKYLGRADNFYTYSGFERSINIGFKIAAQSKEEMKPLYRKAATLASITAPTYGSNGRFMRGSIAKVTVGDYIYEQPGIIESVQYSWQKDYPWEISFQNPEGKENSQILPHVLDVSLTFKVIHDFLPETGVLPLITNHRPTGNKKKYIELKASEELKTKTDKEKSQADASESNTDEAAVGGENYSMSPTSNPPVSQDLEGIPPQIPNFG